MNGWLDAAELAAWWAIWAGAALTVLLALLLLAQRPVLAFHVARRRQLAHRYQQPIARALSGDPVATGVLVSSPQRHRLFLAELLITPLIDDRDRRRIDATRALVRALSLLPLADRYLRSRWWWRRAIAVRAVGLLQMTDRTAAIVAALDDEHTEVRGAALDALTDVHDPASLPALVVRLHDPSLPPGRRTAALAAFGADCELLVLELSAIDAGHRLNYAEALALFGTARSRPALCDWAADERGEVAAAAFAALAHVGLDEQALPIAVRALDSADVHVRANAARALGGYAGPCDAASALARHLDDAWPVAVQAARALRSLPDAAGRAVLQASAARSGLPGLLARQMLWEARYT